MQISTQFMALSGLMLALLGAAAPALAAPPVLADIFTDQGVIQRDHPISVWGQAAPGERLSVTLGQAASQSVQAGPDGRWRAQLPALEGSRQPLTLAVTNAAGERTQRNGLVVGDVFLCSGQSNMEWPVSGAMSGAQEADGANDGLLRGITIAKTSSALVRDRLDGAPRWQAVTPQTAGSFSASCYYMARELRRVRPDLPIGLIMSSWGGSAIEPWISGRSLRTLPGMADQLDMLEVYGRDPVAATRAFGAVWQKWYQSHEPSSPWAEQAADPAWKAMPAHTVFEEWGVADLADFNGQLWYRVPLRLSAAQAAQGATLHLGIVDDVDITWVNGQVIGSTGVWGRRSYKLPAGTFKAGDNVVHVNVLDNWSVGGFSSPAEEKYLELADGTRIPLANGWEYRRSGVTASPMRAPWEPLSGASVLFNGMIAPLQGYGIAGVAWYQGESNVGRDQIYPDQLKTLMSDWRGHFGRDVPFFVVQIAPFGALSKAPATSYSALLREAQRIGVARDAHAALINTVDIGEPTDIHPPNKQAVGKRLARAARALVYREAISPSGPLPVSARAVGRTSVVLETSGVSGALRAHSSAEAIGFELCTSEATESCRYVRAVPENKTVRVNVPKGMKPTFLRYAWADSAQTNLSDDDGMPLMPFMLAISR